MENNKNYFLVGLFIILTVTAAIVFSLWFTANGKGKYHPYCVRFAESVSGLSAGGAVKFRGVDVGNIDTIAIDPQDTRLIVVGIHVLDTTPIKTDTVASLKLQGITGVVFIELSGGSPGAAALPHAAMGDEPPEIKAQRSSIDMLINRLPMLMDKATTIIDQINKLLANKNVESLSDIIDQSRKAAVALVQQTAQIRALVENANQLIARWNGITAHSEHDIRETVGHLDRTADHADQVMRGLNRASQNAGDLTDTLKDDPSRIIFPPKEQGVPAP